MIAAVPRIMLDLETLSSKPDAIVASIGAVEFGPEGTGQEFYRILNIDAQEAKGRRASASTFAWWCQQSEEARALFKSPPKDDVEGALADFDSFCIGVAKSDKPARVGLQVWGYGSTFDNVVLRSLYDSFGPPAPWGYRGDMCYRTLLNLAKGFVEVPARTGTHHNALDDAKYQAQCAAIYLNRLGVK